MFEHLDLTFTQTYEIGFSLDRPPPYYSNLVTFSPEWLPDDTFERIGRRARVEGWPGWGIKDSHGILDLHDRGLVRLFAARWLWRDPRPRFSGVERAALRFEPLADVGGLQAWRRALDADERVGEAIFRSSLLDDERVCFVGGWDGDDFVSGCLLNRTGPVWGVSNAFGAHDVERWSQLVAFIDEWTGGAALVGYDRDDALPPMAAVGFEPVGDLAVWATPAA